MIFLHFIQNQSIHDKHGIDGTGELTCNAILGLCYVVDGHSRHPNSNILVSNFHEYIQAQRDSFTTLLNDEHAIREYLRNLIVGFHLAHHRKLIPAAMSICLTIFSPSKVYSAHLGDCRLGLICNGSLSWLTYPHNMTMSNIENGLTIDLEYILRTSDDNHIVTNSLNTKKIKRIEVNVFNRIKGSSYLLASDGLWKLELRKILLTVKDRVTEDIVDDLAFVLINS